MTTFASARGFAKLLASAAATALCGLVALAPAASAAQDRPALTTHTQASCYGASCAGLDPEQYGCSADAQPMVIATYHRKGGLLSGGGTAYAQLRYSAACNAGWLRVKSTDFMLVPSAWNPGAQSVGQSGDNSFWNGWTAMVSPSGGQICGGTHVYSFMGRWIRWWFVGCFTAPTPPVQQPPDNPPTNNPPTNNPPTDNPPTDNPPTDNPPTNDPPIVQTPPPPVLYWEQESINHPVNTFLNPHNASGLGPQIATGQWVQVSCKVYDPFIASVNPDGYWYRIASDPWDNAYYSPANTFMNGDPPGGPYFNNTDFSVPDC